MLRNVKPILAALIGLILIATGMAGCAVLQSMHDSDEAGIVYYLPKTMLRVEITLPTQAVAADASVAEGTPGAGAAGSDPVFKVSTFNIPDPKHRYTLHYRRNPFFHDRLCYTLDENNPSLLSSVEVSTEDATPEIAVALAQLLAKTGGSTPFAAVARARGKFGPVVKLKGSRPIILTIDLSEPGALHDANQRLAKLYPGLKLFIPDIEHVEGDGHASCYDKALCFRTSVRVPISLIYQGETIATASRKVPKTGGGEDEFYDFSVVNHRHIGSMDVDRAFMVEKVTRLGFSEGILTHVVVRKPSEVLGTAKLPLAVVDTLLSVPANFVNKLTAPNPQITAQATQLAALNVELAKIVATQRGESALGDTAFKGVFKLQCTRATKGLLAVQ